MAVRKIPKNHLFVTGRFGGQKGGETADFESILESEYMLLLEFDKAVARFETQPVRIPVPGVANGYVPDVLVHYVAAPDGPLARMPLLVDVKHTSDLARNGEKYAPKFAAAKRYAADRGWEFAVVTDKEIRTPRLENLQFLSEYRFAHIPPDDRARVRAHFSQSKPVWSQHELLCAIAPTDTDKLFVLPAIWSMVATGELSADLNQLLSPTTPLTLADNTDRT